MNEWSGVSDGRVRVSSWLEIRLGVRKLFSPTIKGAGADVAQRWPVRGTLTSNEWRMTGSDEKGIQQIMGRMGRGTGL